MYPLSPADIHIDICICRYTCDVTLCPDWNILIRQANRKHMIINRVELDGVGKLKYSYVIVCYSTTPVRVNDDLCYTVVFLGGFNFSFFVITNAKYKFTLILIWTKLPYRTEILQQNLSKTLLCVYGLFCKNFFFEIVLKKEMSILWGRSTLIQVYERRSIFFPICI